MESMEETQQMIEQVEELLAVTPDDAELLQTLSDLYDILSKQVSQANSNTSNPQGPENHKIFGDFDGDDFNDEEEEEEEEDEGFPDVSHIKEGDKYALVFPHWKFGDILLEACVIQAESFILDVVIWTPITVNTIPCKRSFMIGCEKPSCRFGHGYSVHPNQLLPHDQLYNTNLDWVQKELLTYGKKVIFKSQEEDKQLWKIGEITDQLDGPEGPQWEVRVLENRSYCVTVGLKDIRPLQRLKTKENENSDKESITESNSETSITDEDDEEYNDKLVPISNTWGTWETHSTGFASKMMKKMGYVPGRGLGISSQGRLDPVEATPYDRGRPKNPKSSTSRPGLGLTHKKEPKKKKVKKENPGEETEVDMFGFMDTLLSNSDNKTLEKSSNLPSSALPSTDREANKTLAKLQAQIESTQLQYNNAEAAVRRNKGKPMERQFQEKLNKIAKLLEDLKNQSNTLNGHVKRKRERESMYTF